MELARKDGNKTRAASPLLIRLQKASEVGS